MGKRLYTQYSIPNRAGHADAANVCGAARPTAMRTVSFPSLFPKGAFPAVPGIVFTTYISPLFSAMIVAVCLTSTSRSLASSPPLICIMQPGQSTAT